jgi:periplasmic protein TonB
MKNQENKQELIENYVTLDDIIFEKKNQQYGAFDLRKGYEKTMKRSFLLGSAFFIGSLIATNIYANRDQTEMIDYKLVNSEHIILDVPKEDIPPVIPPPVEEPPKVDVPTTEFLPPVISPTEVDDTPPTQETLSVAPPADVTNVGNPNDIGLPIEEGEKPEEIVKIEPVEDKEFITVEIQAQYPGGMKALGEFLSKNLKYPPAAVRANVSGKVFLSFGVDKNGNIYDVQVTKGIGFDCDEEAVRVVKLMPNWSPGRQSSKAVKSRFNLPIAFVLE